MHIKVQQVGKRYLRSWIFRGIDLEFQGDCIYGLTGHNGSGKSTLLQILAGFLSPSEGEIIFEQAGTSIKRDGIHQYLSFSSPYTELIEELTLEEHLKFHQKLRPFIDGMEVGALMDLMELSDEWDKEVRYFSSGMKQRLKLGLSILSDSSFILLDEPGSNLDSQSIQWYLGLIQTYRRGRLMIIASNTEEDLSLCQERISIETYKKG